MPESLSDVAFVADSQRWPHWPVLAVIELGEYRGGPQGCDWPRAGFLVAGHGPVVHVGNVLGLAKGILGLGPQLEPLEKVEFASFEELLEHWRID